MHKGLAFSVLRQFIAVSHSSIAIANGLSLVHSIGVSGLPRRRNRYINKYILPGAYLPALEQTTTATGQQDLKILNIERTTVISDERANIGVAHFSQIVPRYDIIIMGVFSACGNSTLLVLSVFCCHKLIWCCSFSSAMIITSRRWDAVKSRTQKTVSGIHCARRLFLATHAPRRNDTNTMGVVM